MRDVRSWLAKADRVPVPDLWSEIERRAASRAVREVAWPAGLHQWSLKARAAVAVLAISIAAAGIAFAWIAFRPLGGRPAVRPGRTPPGSSRVVHAEPSATIATQGEEAASISASGDGVWLVFPEVDPGAPCSGAVERIDPTTNTLTDVYPVGATPTAVQATPDLVWVAAYPCATGKEWLPSLFALTPSDGRVVASVEIPVPDGIVTGLARSEGSIWVAVYDPDTEEGAVIAVDETSHEIMQRLPLEGRLKGIAVTGGAIWVLRDRPDIGGVLPRTALLRVDATSGAAVPLFEGEVDTYPSRFSLASTPSGVWIGSGDTASFVDETGATAAEFELPGELVGFGPFAANEAGVWFLGVDVISDRQVIGWLDAETGAVSTVVPLPGPPTAAAVDDGSVWVALFGGGVARVDFTTSPDPREDAPAASSP